MTKKVVEMYQRKKPVASDKSGFRKSVFIEALGNGGVSSLNYEMRLVRFKNDGLGIRVGIGLGEYFPGGQAEFNRYISVPIALNHIMGKNRNGLETGVGLTPQIALSKLKESPQFKPLGYLNVGYRYQPLKDGFLFRATWTPIISNGFDPVWLGLSVGYSFR